MSLLFNMLSRLVIAFLSRSKRLLISWLQSPSAVILEPKKIKSLTVSTVSPSICHEVMGPDVMILVFWILSFKPAFSVSYFTFIKRLFSSSSLSALEWHHLHIWGYWYFSQQSWFQLVLHPAWHFTWYILYMGFPGGSDGKVSGYNAGDPGSGRSPGEGNGNPLQYSCLENSMDGGA